MQVFREPENLMDWSSPGGSILVEDGRRTSSAAGSSLAGDDGEKQNNHETCRFTTGSTNTLDSQANKMWFRKCYDDCNDDGTIHYHCNNCHVYHCNIRV